MLTPKEIESREFLVALRGYDRDEVHAFLGEVAALVRQLRKGAPAASPAEDASEMFAHIAKDTQRILEAAQEAGEEIKRRAKQESEREVKDARAQAAKLIADGERKRERLERELVGLQEARAALADSLRGVGRTLEQTLRALAAADPATSVREAIRAEASAQDEADALTTAGEQPLEGGPQPRAAMATADAVAEPEHAPVAEPGAPAPVDAASEEAERTPGAGADPASEATVAQTPAEGPGPAAAEAASDHETEAQALRSQALSSLHPKLVRKVKRGLQDMQNAALDRLRRAGEDVEEEAYLPTDDEVRIVGLMAGDFLDEAYAAGVAAASRLADRPLPEPNEPRALDNEFVDEVSERIRTPLAATLRMGLASGQGGAGLNDRMGAVFGELKGAVAEELAATHLVRAYEAGMLDTWRAGEVRARRWVLGREPRCPEARCRQNDQTGEVPVGEDFPSGDPYPPVHAGCTCTTVPVL